mgnify:CR=1 FL=1
MGSLQNVIDVKFFYNGHIPDNVNATVRPRPLLTIQRYRHNIPLEKWMSVRDGILRKQDDGVKMEGDLSIQKLGYLILKAQ